MDEKSKMKTTRTGERERERERERAAFPKGDEKGDAAGATAEREQKGEDLVNLSVVIRGRNRRRGTNSIASIALFCEPARNLHPRRPTHPLFPRGEWATGWFVGWLLGFAATPPLQPLIYPYDRRKSLRLTGSRRITGTRDIYASSPRRPGHYP